MLEQGAWLKSIALTFVAAVILWLAIPVFVELKSRFDVNNEIDSKISARTKDLEVARKQNVKDKEVALAGALDEVKLAKEALKNLSHRGAPPLLDILSNDRVFDDSFITPATLSRRVLETWNTIGAVLQRRRRPICFKLFWLRNLAPLRSRSAARRSNGPGWGPDW
jgi:hypothetical protein